MSKRDLLMSKRDLYKKPSGLSQSLLYSDFIYSDFNMVDILGLTFER